MYSSNQTTCDFIFNQTNRVSAVDKNIDRECLATYFRQMFLLDYILFNRDRHGNNIELLYNDMIPVYLTGIISAVAPLILLLFGFC
jgi:hypothetical protein